MGKTVSYLTSGSNPTGQGVVQANQRAEWTITSPGR